MTIFMAYPRILRLISAVGNMSSLDFWRSHLSLLMRKPDFCIWENKDADQLRGKREADQRLGFRYTDSTIPLLPKFRKIKPLAIFCGCTARFVWDLVRNPKDRFSHNEAHLIPGSGTFFPLLSATGERMSWVPVNHLG